MGWEEWCEVLGDTNWTDVVVSVSKIFDIIKDIPHAWSPSTVRTENMASTECEYRRNLDAHREGFV